MYDVDEQHSEPVLTCLDNSGQPVTAQLQTYLSCYCFIVFFPQAGVTRHDSCHFCAVCFVHFLPEEVECRLTAV